MALTSVFAVGRFVRLALAYRLWCSFLSLNKKSSGWTLCAVMWLCYVVALVYGSFSLLHIHIFVHKYVNSLPFVC